MLSRSPDFGISLWTCVEHESCVRVMHERQSNRTLNDVSFMKNKIGAKNLWKFPKLCRDCKTFLSQTKSSHLQRFILIFFPGELEAKNWSLSKRHGKIMALVGSINGPRQPEKIFRSSMHQQSVDWGSQRGTLTGIHVLSSDWGTLNKTRAAVTSFFFPACQFRCKF